MTTYRHADLHAARAVQHFSQLVTELGHSAAIESGGGLRAQVCVGEAGLSLVAGPASSVPASRTGADRGSIVVEAPDRESSARVEATVESRLHRLAEADPLTVTWSDPVRPATIADDQALLALDRRSWDEASSLPSRRMREGPTFFRPGGRSPAGLLLAERDGVPIGMVKVHPKSPFPESAHVFAVVNLVVAPEMRRQGVAAMLLTVAEHVARGRGARKLNLMVRAGNRPALQLYADHGYLVEGHFSNEFLINGRYLDDLSLSKSIED